MSKKYNHKEIEPKWQENWRKLGIYDFDPNNQADKKYVLVEFPYPSGVLHAGHMYAFSVPDMYSRFKRMQGYNVFFPFGFDSFGLPAENAAIKNNINPKDWTDKNINQMTEQMKLLGTMIDFKRLIKTSDPSFYKYTQWLFNQFYKNDLVYRGMTLVNWCPKDKTILANEQVVGGKCERCETEVEQKEMPQWMFRITKYADRLINDLDPLDWPREIKDAQKNWVGKSEGSYLDFEIKNNKKYNYVLIHGYKASPNHNFHQYLKSELEKRGHDVIIPELPNPDNPNIDDQVKSVLDQVKFDENTIVLGHSLGTVVAMKILEKIKVKINRLILVSPFVTPKFKDKPREFEDTFNWEFNFELIKQNTKSVTLLADKNDDAVSIDRVLEVKDKIGGRLIEVVASQKHFRDEEEIEVLRASLPSVKVFTTRADTIYGVSFLALAPENLLIAEFDYQNQKTVEDYQKKSKQKSELERKQNTQKSGVLIEGVSAIHPLTGKELPIYTADYILNNYGTGAIMGVPAHDERDLEFAQAFDLPIITVIEKNHDSDTEILINSGEFSGLDSNSAKIKITEKINGVISSTYRLRDWGISRQRYWGTPIPIVYDKDGNPHPVPDEHLPWVLPQDVDFIPDGTAPLSRSKELIKRTKEIFGEGFTPEFDTMDTFVDSTWYFIRYLDYNNQNKYADESIINRYLPVDFYSGGAEHTTMHLLYARFWYKAMFDLGLVPNNEPFIKRLNRGLILGTDGRKMSKRWGNVLDPIELIETFGADSLRMYMAFIAPFNETSSFPWDNNGLVGIRRFIERIYSFNNLVVSMQADNKLPDNSLPEIRKILHKTIDKVTNDFDNLKSNTAVSALMIFSNELRRSNDESSTFPISLNDYVLFLRLLAPFIPHLTDEMYQDLGYDHSVHESPWPVPEYDLLVDEEINIPVQFNGKVKFTFKIKKDLDDNQVVNVLNNHPEYNKSIEGKNIMKVIIVKNKIINIVFEK